ncbi:hypothetical protein B0T10DRAFT_463272 [Thelonectria olida]|uniref:Uncharacterized protein n=1 Tax=Thelonectria olida TaxID=1576542 RepID=A0A9P9AIE8_9HYPO|nr:hypothetical protein B0T10DRAFT_463272 [Thelonectria olida]
MPRTSQHRSLHHGTPQILQRQQTPARASQPPILAPLDTDDAPYRSDEMPATTIVRNASRARSHETSGRRSEDADAHELSEGAPQSSSGAPVPPFPPLGPTKRCRARRQAVQRLVQEDDDGSSDAGSDLQGSESYLEFTG